MHKCLPVWNTKHQPYLHTKSWVYRRMEIVAKAPSVGGLFEVELSWLVAPKADEQ